MWSICSSAMRLDFCHLDFSLDSLTWSLEMYQQTNARLWRQGQREVVTAHHIVCRDTVDGEVLKALEHKETTQQNLIAAVKAAVGR